MRIIFFQILVFSFFHSAAQFVKTNGPYNSTGGMITEIDNYLLYSTECGEIYRSSNRGLNWIKTNFNVGIQSTVTEIVTIDSLVYASYENYIRVSLDSGLNWTTAFICPFPIRSISANDNFLFITTDNKLFRSSDGGIQWDTLYRSAHLVSAHDSIVAYSFYDAVYISHNNGTTWLSNSTLLWDDVSALTVTDSEIFAGTWTTGSYRINLSGSQYTSAGGSLNPTISIRCFVVDDPFAIEGTNDGLNLSVDSGNNFNAVTKPGPYPCIFDGLAIDSGLIVVTSYGPYLSFDSGATWNRRVNGLNEIFYENIYTYFNKDFFSGYSTGDNGNSFTGLIGWPEGAYLRAAVHHDNVLIAVSSMGILYSNDSGNTWSQRGNVSSLLINSIVSDNNKLFITGYNTYTSIDSGLTWSGFNKQFQQLIKFDSLLIGWKSWNGFRYEISPDHGQTWITDSLDNPGNGNIDKMFECSGILFAFHNGKLYRTLDYGSNWTDITPSGAYIEDATGLGSYLYLTHLGDLYRSVDNGNSWIIVPGISGVNKVTVGINGVYAFKFCEGIWHSAHSIINDLESTALEDKLIFPNPAKNKIHLNLLNPGKAIYIYNLFGELVTIKKLNLEKTLDVQDLVAGLYLILDPTTGIGGKFLKMD